MMTITEHDTITGETIQREPLPHEIAQLKLDAITFVAIENEIKAREMAKQSRREKLMALGLTEDELDA